MPQPLNRWVHDKFSETMLMSLICKSYYVRHKRYLCDTDAFDLDVCFQVVVPGRSWIENVNRELHCSGLDCSDLWDPENNFRVGCYVRTLLDQRNASNMYYLADFKEVTKKLQTYLMFNKIFKVSSLQFVKRTHSHANLFKTLCTYSNTKNI